MLLVLVMLLPAACVLWFLNEAVITQSAAARQAVLEAYRGQLRLVRSRIDGHWRAEAARLNSTANPAQQFARLMLDGVSDGVVLLYPDGRVAYPNDAPASAEVAAIERLLSTTDELDDVAAKLNDYTIRLTGSERLTLMTRLRRLVPNVSLPTEAALRLSMELIAAERPVSSPGGGLRETALRDIWALTSDDGRVDRAVSHRPAGGDDARLPASGDAGGHRLSRLSAGRHGRRRGHRRRSVDARAGSCRFSRST